MKLKHPTFEVGLCLVLHGWRRALSCRLSCQLDAESWNVGIGGWIWFAPQKAGIGAMLALQIFLGAPFLQVHCWAGPIV